MGCSICDPTLVQSRLLLTPRKGSSESALRGHYTNDTEANDFQLSIWVCAGYSDQLCCDGGLGCPWIGYRRPHTVSWIIVMYPRLQTKKNCKATSHAEIGCRGEGWIGYISGSR